MSGMAWLMLRSSTLAIKDVADFVGKGCMNRPLGLTSMSDSSIPLARVSAFIRQYTHDVRNSINCMDLEMELMQDVVTDPEAVISMTRIREQLRSLEVQMRALSGAFQDPRPTPDRIPARVLLQMWQEKADAAGAFEVRWLNQLAAEEVEVDVEMMAAVFNELLTNAAAFSPDKARLSVTACRDGDAVSFQMVEAGKQALDPAEWARPFSAPTRGRYGLGLWGVKRRLEANGASFRQHYNAGEESLLTEIRIPVKEGA